MSSAVPSRSSTVSPVEASSQITAETTSRATPMHRCFLIFIVRAPTQSIIIPDACWMLSLIHI